MADRETDVSENPYRSPAGMDDGPETATRRRRQRTRDMALAGLVFGIAYGAGTGAAITVCLEVVQGVAWLASVVAGRELPADFDYVVMGLGSHFAAVALFGGFLGMISGAMLGPLQGVMTAHSTSSRRARLARFGAFCWAVIAAIWCLLIDQAMLSTEDRQWPLYVALVLAPLAAGIGGVVVASKLVRVRSG
jgi:hypothetical protein